MTQTVTPKKLCWNCDGNVELDTQRCPYCAADLESPVAVADENVEPELTPPYPAQEQMSSPAEATQAGGLQELSPGDMVWPLAMILSGAVFLLFGLALFLHSGQEYMTLQWSSDAWPMYLIPALPLLYFGWKRLPKYQ